MAKPMPLFSLLSRKAFMRALPNALLLQVLSVLYVHVQMFSSKLNCQLIVSININYYRHFLYRNLYHFSESPKSSRFGIRREGRGRIEGRTDCRIGA
ncbi:hypothetical protein gpAD87_18960 [Paenibacillus sp. AD87]|nr:hypothetical protein gpAD87_18960 [Paenibacillus sp. AD87]